MHHSMCMMYVHAASCTERKASSLHGPGKRPTHLTHELERTIETIQRTRHRVGDHNPDDKSASASMNGLVRALTMETSWQGVATTTGQDRTRSFGRDVTWSLHSNSYLKLMYSWSEQTDRHTHGQTRNNVARSRLALTAQTRQFFLSFSLLCKPQGSLGADLSCCCVARIRFYEMLSILRNLGYRGCSSSEVVSGFCSVESNETRFLAARKCCIIRSKWALPLIGR